MPVTYPSDAQLDASGNVVVAGYTNSGYVVAVSPSGSLLWCYGPASGPGRLGYPSLAVPLPNGLVAVNDDFRARVVIIDPKTGQIVWQYGTTGWPGRALDRLYQPDGINLIPPGMLARTLAPPGSHAQ